MSDDPPVVESGTLSPNDAFGVLGNETRLQILQTLGEANRPLAFSGLFDRVDYDDTANFSYHLEKLTGHFVERGEEGYVLRQPGRRVVEAVLSGAVTDAPVFERSPVERACFLCGGAMEVDYQEERVGIYCRDCEGTRGGASPTAPGTVPESAPLVGTVSLPPAGVHDRSADAILDTAQIWTVTAAQALARDVCPRCAAPVDTSVLVCEDHDSSDGTCSSCDQAYAVVAEIACTNCIFSQSTVFTKLLLGNPDMIRFMIDLGIDPMVANAFHLAALEETVHSTDPFEASFTFRADGEALTLTVDDDLSVQEATRESVPERTAE